jgi:hypothetical protein
MLATQRLQEFMGIFVSFLSWNKLTACVLIDFLLKFLSVFFFLKKERKNILRVWSPLMHFNELPPESHFVFSGSLALSQSHLLVSTLGQFQG